MNIKDKKRATLFQHFILHLDLVRVSIDHKTYHHFVGEGVFVSNVDVILHTQLLPKPEEVREGVKNIQRGGSSKSRPKAAKP